MTSLASPLGLHLFGSEPDPISHTTRVTIPEGLQLALSEISPYGWNPVDGGGQSDVWKADLIRDGAKTVLVALKVLRRNGDSQAALYKRFKQEVACWKNLKHENIAPLYGVCSNWHAGPAVVLPWYESGTAREYLQRHPDADPIPIIQGIANGLAYMHVHDIVHGDVKGANVMIDNLGHARLIDFGFSHFTDVFVDSLEGFSIRWSAPELLHPDSVSTSSSDVYSFASTACELLTGQIPYNSLRVEAVVIEAVRRGTPPWGPGDDFAPFRLSAYADTRELFGLLKSCWVEVGHRPSISDVRRCLMSF